MAEKPSGRRRWGPLDDFRALWRHPAANALFTIAIGVSTAARYLQERAVSGWDLLVLVPIMLGAVLGAAGYAFRGRPIRTKLSGAGLALSMIGLAIAVLSQLLVLYRGR